MLLTLSRFEFNDPVLCAILLLGYSRNLNNTSLSIENRFVIKRWFSLSGTLELDSHCQNFQYKRSLLCYAWIFINGHPWVLNNVEPEHLYLNEKL